MRSHFSSRRILLASALLLGSFPLKVLADDILQTTGFSNCVNNATITIQDLTIDFDRNTNMVIFNVTGTNTQVQNVSASLVVSAYGKVVYSKDFNPCEAGTFISEICPGRR